MVALMIALIKPVPRWIPSCGKQPTSDKGAENPDNEVTNETKAGPAHDLTCQPAGNQTDKQDEQQAFTGHVHWVSRSFVWHSAGGCPSPIWSTSIIMRADNTGWCARVMRSRSPISSQMAALHSNCIRRLF